MLSDAERRLLEQFSLHNEAGTPYWRRVNIILMHNAGLAPESIAVELGTSIPQTRKWINTFKREGMRIFPDQILRTAAAFSPDDHIAEAGRAFMRQQLEVILVQRQQLQAENGSHPIAVHEIRKAIRRLRNAFRVLAPYYEPDYFKPFQKRFRKTMRRVGPARDLYVFVSKLDSYRREAELHVAEMEALETVALFWRAQLEIANEEAGRATKQQRFGEALEAFRTVVTTSGAGVPARPASVTPVKVRHLAPLIIFQRLADVRAFDDLLAHATLEELHQLRIRFKRLRYTLDFLAPVLGLDIVNLLGDLDTIQDHLGDLNDANVALDLLHQTPAGEGREVGVAIYREKQQAEVVALRESFGAVWTAFDSSDWRQRLFNTVTPL